MGEDVETAGLTPPRGYRALLAFYFLQEGTCQFLLMAITTLFLKRFGADGLPWYYIGNNIIFISTQMLMMGRREWKGHAFLARFDRLLVLLCLGLACASTLGTVPLFLVALSFGVFYLHSYQAGGELTGEVLSLQQAKVFLPRVFAAGTAGCILGGLALKFLVDTFGFRGVFLVAATAFLINDVLLARLKPCLITSSPIDEAEAAPEGGTAPATFVWSRFPAIRTFAVVLWLVAFMASFSRFLIDFLYSTNLSLFFPSEADLAGFFGVFGAALDVTVFLLQTFVVGKLFQAIPLAGVFAARALVVGVIALVSFVAPSVASVAAAQFLFLGMTWTFTNPASLMFLEIVPETPRQTLRRSVAMGESAANVLVGLFLLLPAVAAGKAASWLFLVVAGLSLFHFVLALSLGPIGSGAVSESLGWTEAGGERDLSFLDILPPKEATERLVSLLSASEAEHRFRLLAQTGTTGVGAAALLRWLPSETEPRHLVAALRAIASRNDPGLVSGIHDCLQGLREPARLATFLDALGTARLEAGAAWASPFLGHADCCVRQSATVCLLQLGYDEADLGRALDSLRSLMTGTMSAERAAGAGVMGAIGLPLFVPGLAHLADDPDPVVAGTALQGLAGIPTLPAVREIARRRSAPGEHGRLARLAWSAAGKGRRKAFSLLGALTDAERESLLPLLRQVSDQLDEGVLAGVFRQPRAGVREALLVYLGERGPTGGALVSRCLAKDGAPDAPALSASALLAELEGRALGALFPEAGLLGLAGGVGSPEITGFLHRTLRKAWQVHLLPRHPAWKGAPPPADGDNPSPHLRRLLAFATDDPQRCRDALSKLVSGDRYAQSLAQEYLERHLGKPLLGMIAPFLGPELRFPAVVPPECRRLLEEANLPLPSATVERTTFHA